MRGAWAALGAYVAITIAATWPLVLGLDRDVAWDLGDPLFVMWALAWDCEQLLAAFGGDPGRLASLFDANIFHPAPLTLAYSEHFVGQALQVLPVYAATGNPILCYNLLFLSTFALAGLGAYLFVRELTGSRAAGLVAGLAFAFAPYRFPQASHLQVLSSQWMPLALYGFLRYFETGRLRPLVGAASALVVQNLSCLYYVLYFSPFAAAYVLWEMVRRRLWHQRRVWLHLAAVAILVLAITAPFLVPYAAVREIFPAERQRDEVVLFSADVYSYATAFPQQPLWGPLLRAYPKAEGTLFPGFVTLALASAGLMTWRRSGGSAAAGAAPAASSTPTGAASGVSPNDLVAPRASMRPVRKARRPRILGIFEGGATQRDGMQRRPNAKVIRRHHTRFARAAAILLAMAAAVHLIAAVIVIIERRVVIDLGPVGLRMTNVNQLLIRAVVLTGALLALSRSARLRWLAFLDSRGFFVASLVAAVWLSLGPEPQVMGRRLNLLSPYALLYDYVPGFDGVRVPARLAMVAVLMLSVLAGFGALAISRRRWGPPALVLLSAAILAEGLVVPFAVNATGTVPGYAPLEARVYAPAEAPAAYRRLAEEPDATVVVELPLGDYHDLRAVYYSTAHWRPLVNGYSGFFPIHYEKLALALDRVPQQGDVAWAALRAAGATVVLVHEGAFLGAEGPETSAALRQRGAVEIFRDGTDVLLRLPPGGG